MLGNINPKFRSALHTIQLLTVVRTTLIEKYGINKILEPLMTAVHKLESVIKIKEISFNIELSLFCVQDDGVIFVVDDHPMKLRGTITVVSADNPAAFTLGGFKNLHSAFRKCRTCMATDDDMQTKVTMTNLNLTYCLSHTHDSSMKEACNYVIL